MAWYAPAGDGFCLRSPLYASDISSTYLLLISLYDGTALNCKTVNKDTGREISTQLLTENQSMFIQSYCYNS